MAVPRAVNVGGTGIGLTNVQRHEAIEAAARHGRCTTWNLNTVAKKLAAMAEG